MQSSLIALASVASRYFEETGVGHAMLAIETLEARAQVLNYVLLDVGAGLVTFWELYRPSTSRVDDIPAGANTIVRKTRSGLESARKRGKVGSRPRVVAEDKRRIIIARHEEDDESVREIARATGFSVSTVHGAIAQHRAAQSTEVGA